MSDLHEASSDAITTLLPDLRPWLETAFDGDFTDEDWAHALGGVHVWVSDPQGLISHGSLVDRTILCAGQTLRVGYVEAVATAPAFRRQGYGTRVMRRLGDLIRAGHPLGVLSTGHHPFYERFGWERWRGPTFANGPQGRTATPEDDGGILILRTPHSPALDLDEPIVADWRRGDVW